MKIYEKLGEWLVEYNTVLAHHSLEMKPLVKWLIEKGPECQKCWTNTTFWLYFRRIEDVIAKDLKK
ncbi:hypothetical protein TH606_02235 [Thermodesulfatator autotrophicus]|uniref:Uncharacterized protein n=1 Tax=Thermodesulfatator autotrophicus TaxID=1795632 RepID=A0A177EA47_9BACT|nr:hypothetical protein TH606_02235 [Thermodesulfatator autotrophicus]